MNRAALVGSKVIKFTKAETFAGPPPKTPRPPAKISATGTDTFVHSPSPSCDMGTNAKATSGKPLSNFTCNSPVSSVLSGSSLMSNLKSAVLNGKSTDPMLTRLKVAPVASASDTLPPPEVITSITVSPSESTTSVALNTPPLSYTSSERSL